MSFTTRRPDLKRAVSIATQTDELTDVPTRRDFKPQIEFDSKLYTKRELNIMETLAMFFEGATATQMSTLSHSSKMPWKRVYDVNQSKEIPYALTLESEPILKHMPTIQRDELAFRDEAFAEVRAHTKP